MSERNRTMRRVGIAFARVFAHAFTFAVALAFTLAFARPARAAVIHVAANAAPGGDGGSWTTAFRDLQDGLAAAVPGDEIWVAEGTYHPDRGTGFRSMSFELRSGVAILGGFAGDEVSALERDPQAHPTVLSGDLAGNDASGSVGDNSYHVASAIGLATLATLDGVIVRGGNASGAAAASRGGGIFAFFSDLSMKDVVVEGCRASYFGGGMSFRLGELTLERVSFTGCTASYGGGLGINESDVLALNCNWTAVGDANTLEGGAIYVTGSILKIFGGAFEGNVASRSAAGLAMSQVALLASDVEFINNALTSPASEVEGTVIRSNGSVEPLTLLGCTFSGNNDIATGYGDDPVVFFASAGSSANVPVLVSGCTFLGNGGAGLWILSNAQSAVTVTNSSFLENEGTGLHVSGSSAIEVAQCAFVGNLQAQSSNEDGGGVALRGQGSVVDCVFLSNVAPLGAGGADLSGGPWSVTGCVVQGNTAQNGVGGMRITPNGPPAPSTVDACRFEANAPSALSVLEHPALVRDSIFVGNDGFSALLIGGGPSGVLRCDFFDNSADWGSGLRCSVATGTPVFIDSCRFWGNRATGVQQWGGTIALERGSFDLVNVLVSGNLGPTGTAGGAGIFCRDAATVTRIASSTIVGNTSFGNGDGLYLADGAAILTNSLLWANGSGAQAQQLAAVGGSVSLSHCSVQGWTGTIGGVANNGLNPLFVNAAGDDGLVGTPDDNLTLAATSPARESGDAGLLPLDVLDRDADGDLAEVTPLDLAGGSRVVGLLDRGAYESPAINARRGTRGAGWKAAPTSGGKQHRRPPRSSLSSSAGR